MLNAINTHSKVSPRVGEALGVGRHDAPSVPSEIMKKFLFFSFNPIALKKAKIVYNFGLSEYNSVKMELFTY